MLSFYQNLIIHLISSKFLPENRHMWLFNNENVTSIFQIPLFIELSSWYYTENCHIYDFCCWSLKEVLETDFCNFHPVRASHYKKTERLPPIRPRQSFGSPRIPKYVRGIVGRFQCTQCTKSTVGFELRLNWKENWHLNKKL